MAIVGIIGDTHIPYERKDYLAFCKKTFKKHKVNRVVHIGDLIDHHGLSFHESEPALQGAHGEMINAIQRLKPWFRAFPKMELIMGNHDRIPARQLKKIGMDHLSWMRPIQEVYQFPKGWKVHDHVIIDGVTYHHGETAAGVNGFRLDSQKRMGCTVTGHAHSNAGISATASHSKLIWGMAVGCGVDIQSMAFAYGKHFPLKPIIACGIVKHGHPTVEYADL